MKRKNLIIIGAVIAFAAFAVLLNSGLIKFAIINAPSPVVGGVATVNFCNTQVTFTDQAGGHETEHPIEPYQAYVTDDHFTAPTMYTQIVYENGSTFTSQGFLWDVNNWAPDTCRRFTYDGGVKTVEVDNFDPATVTPACVPSESCGAWSACSGSTQSRSCSDGCGNTTTRTQSCTVTVNPPATNPPATNPPASPPATTNPSAAPVCSLSDLNCRGTQIIYASIAAVALAFTALGLFMWRRK